MLNRTVLEQAGIDMDEALQRVMGNEALFDRLLGMFSNDQQHANLHAAIDTHDADAAIAAAHSLKGTCGNLSMKPLYELSSKQLELLRAGKWDEAAALMPAIDSAYAATQEAITARSS